MLIRTREFGNAFYYSVSFRDLFMERNPEAEIASRCVLSKPSMMKTEKEPRSEPMNRRTVIIVSLTCVALFLFHVSPDTSHAQGGTSTLTVTSGPSNQGGVNPLANATVVLLNESFESILRKSHAFDGQPSILKAWHTACVNRSPLCRKGLEQLEEAVVANGQMDATGKTTLTNVPAGSYYLLSFALSIQSAAGLVWDMKIDLRPGANSITLNEANVASFDIRSAKRTAQPAASTAGDFQCRVPEAPTRPNGPANSTLAVSGSGYKFTVTNTQTGAVIRTERGNFVHTTFFLLDNDVEVIWQQAGVKPAMGMSMMDSVHFYSNLSDPNLGKGNPAVAMATQMGNGLGIGDPTKGLQQLAKAQYDCALKATNAHSLAKITTDAAARGVFPKVPAGTYYVFGQFTGGHPVIWNLKVDLKPGPNALVLSPQNAAYTYGASK